MKVVAIHQPQYVPYLGYFHKIKHCDVFVHLDHVAYQPKGFHSRNKIKGLQGEQWLSVPVNGSQNDRIIDVCIDPTARKWREKHWKTLKANYARAPYFKQYAPELEALYLGSEGHHQLSSVNQSFSDWAMSALGIATPTRVSSGMDAGGASTDLLISLCRQLGGTHYLSGPGGKLYMDMQAFSQAGIEVIWQNYQPPVYDQVFPAAGFIEHLSVLDVLFSMGDRAGQVL